ncbi:MAG: glycosyltransferase family 39 protein [Acidimicrobiia bacterium]|nr:glycosyltransferase family 39 protein [Acidimicrobiia bacterium]
MGPVVVGALARGAYWRFVTPDWEPISDADHYLRLARSLASGTGFSMAFPQLEMHATAFRPPLYPLLLAIVEWVGGADVLWPARLLSLVLGLAVIALTVKLGERLAGPTSGFVAGGMVAVYPPLVANDTITLSEPLALLLILGILLKLHDRRWVACGVLTGLLLLTRPNAYLVVVVVVAALWRLIGHRRALLSACVCAAVVSPWIIRNQIQVDTIRPTTSDGFTLAAMYAPPAREHKTFVNPVYDTWYDGTEFELLQFDEARWSSALTDLALDTISDDPSYVVTVARRNTIAFFELDTSANETAERFDGRNIDFRTATLPLFYVVTILGLMAIALNIRRRAVWPTLAIAAQFTVLSLLIVAPPRLRAPFDLTMCIGVGLLAEGIRQRYAIVDVPPRRPAPSRSRP